MINPFRRHVIPAVVGLLLAAAAAAIIPFASAPHRFVTASGLLARAAGLCLVGFAVTLLAVRLTSRIVGLASPRQLGVRTALAAAWFAPLLMFASQRSWLALALWAIAAVEVTRLSCYVSRLAEEESGQDHQDKLRGPLFTILGQGWGCNVDSLVGSFGLEAAICAGVDSRFVLACFFLVGCTIALVRRGWKMLLDSPSRKEINLHRRSLAVVAITTLLVAFAWLPRAGGFLGGGDRGVLSLGLTHHTLFENAHQKDRLV